MANLRLPMDTTGKSQPELAILYSGDLPELDVLAKAANYCS